MWLNSWYVVGTWLYLLNAPLTNNFLFTLPLSLPQGQFPGLSLLTPSFRSIPIAMTLAQALSPGPLSQPPTRPPDLQSMPRADLSPGPWTRSQPLSPATLFCLMVISQSPGSWLCLCWWLWSLLLNGITSSLALGIIISYQLLLKAFFLPQEFCVFR